MRAHVEVNNRGMVQGNVDMQCKSYCAASAQDSTPTVVALLPRMLCLTSVQ